MKPRPPHTIRPTPPNPLCPLCKEHAACVFHAATTPQQLGAAFFATLRQRGALALVDFLTWALTNIEEMVPAAVLDKLSELDRSVIEDEFAQLLELEGFDTDDLRRLAAVALATALMTEQQEQDEDDAPDHTPQERRPADNRSSRTRR